MTHFTTYTAAHTPEGHRFGWSHDDESPRESGSIRWENEGFVVQGVVTAERCEYVLRLGPDWRVRQFLLFRDMDEPDLWLANDGDGRWGEMRGARRPELDGCTDMALGFTPFTHTPIVRRLGLDVGQSALVQAVAVNARTLDVQPTLMEYTRERGCLWRAVDRRTNTDTAFTVDDRAMVSAGSRDPRGLRRTD